VLQIAALPEHATLWIVCAHSVTVIGGGDKNKEDLEEGIAKLGPA
jgi:hypothetical protein